MLRASLGASALAAVVALGWGCGLSVSDSQFPSSSSSGGNAAVGGNAANGGNASQGGATDVGGSGQGGPGSGGGAQGGAQGGAGQGGAGQGGAGNGGPGGGPGSGGGSNCPGLGDACSDCAATSCTATYCACYGNASCDSLSVCFSQCSPGDDACYQACETMYPDGISAFFLLDNCSAASCSAQCPGTLALNPCQICLFSDCDTEMNACLGNAECAAILACVAQCPQNDMTCPVQCFTSHPAGETDANAVRLCSNTHCSGSCP